MLYICSSQNQKNMYNPVYFQDENGVLYYLKDGIYTPVKLNPKVIIGGRGARGAQGPIGPQGPSGVVDPAFGYAYYIGNSYSITASPDEPVTFSALINNSNITLNPDNKTFLIGKTGKYKIDYLVTCSSGNLGDGTLAHDTYAALFVNDAIAPFTTHFGKFVIFPGDPSTYQTEPVIATCILDLNAGDLLDLRLLANVETDFYEIAGMGSHNFVTISLNIDKVN